MGQFARILFIRAYAVVIAALVVIGCGEDRHDSEKGGSAPPTVAAPRSYERMAQASSDTYHGYDCTEDCSGHEAGYTWAENHDITDPDDCGGNSESFIEGCQAHAEEAGDTEDDDNDDN